MIEGKGSEQRHVLPRWRTLRQSHLSGEFESIRSGPVSAGLLHEANRISGALRRDFEAHKKAWIETDEVSVAEEVLTSALVLNARDDPTVLSAAIAVSANSNTARAMADFASSIVHGIVTEATSPELLNDLALRREISRKKRLLALNPRDGLLTAETALLHLNLGQRSKAKSLLQHALHVCPNHRYVLRAAVRFWCHQGDPERALAVLRASERTKSDPWLKAAELATEAIAGSSPTRWKAAKELVRSGHFSMRSLSELASQVGTFELMAGSRKQALEMLRVGAASPTENSVAQIEFVGRETASFEPDELVGGQHGAYEAEAHRAYWTNRWDDALEACEEWHLIEPFSTRPAIVGTFVASVRSTSLERGLALAMAVHNANPNDATLLNNLAVIHAYLGNKEKAREALGSSRASDDGDMAVTHLATEGLIEFRTGNFETGLHLYEEAIHGALQQKNFATALRAYCFLGREMSRVGGEWADVFGQQVDSAIERLKRRGVPIPRDVEIIRAQFPQSRPLDFGPLSLRAPLFSDAFEELIE